MRNGGSLLIGILLACVIGWWMSGSVGVVSSEEPAKSDAKPGTCDVEKPLFPPDRSVLLSGTVNVVCKAKSNDAKLMVEGRPWQWESFQPPLHVARLTLSPGIYELRIGDYRSEFCVAMNPEEYDAPSDWKLQYSHPMPNKGEKRCAGCHELKRDDQQAFSVAGLKPSKSCFKCHATGECQEIQGRPLEPTTRCQDCHSLHDSTRKELLKASVKKSPRDPAAPKPPVGPKPKCP